MLGGKNAVGLIQDYRLSHSVVDALLVSDIKSRISFPMHRKERQLGRLYEYSYNF